MPQNEPIPLPIERHPGELVENVYPDPATVSLPDLESQDEMGEYLESRFEPDPGPQTRIALIETGRTLPRLTRPIVGYKEGAQYERDGWIVTPRVAAAVMLGTAVLSVAKPTLQDIGDEIKVGAHEVYRFFNPVESVTITEEVPTTGPSQHIKSYVAAPNQAGSSLVDEAQLASFRDQVAKALVRDGKVVSVTVTGRSSDEYGSDTTIGKPESPAQDFADDRAKAYASALKSDTGVFADAKIIVKVDQDVLTPGEKAQVAKAAEKAGFSGPNEIVDAIAAVESGQNTTPKLRALVNKLFTGKRGVTLDVAITLPGEQRTEVVTHTEPGEDNPPADPKRDYDPWFIPMIPIPRLRRYAQGIKPIRKLKLESGRPILTPTIIKEEAEQAWVRVRPEAVNEDGSLKENAWAYTRKYEYLLRDGRIKDVLRADFPDRDGGEAKSIRIMFVDMTPAAETVAVFEGLLQKFAAMENGKIADRVSGIFVYPDKNAGVGHRDPKRVNVGIDKQSHASILGTYTYALDLVELHMPDTWDPEELDELMASFYGPAFTLAHEVAGHGTDDSDATLRLRRVRTSGIPNAHIMTGDPRAQKMRPLQTVLRNLKSSRRSDEPPVQFDISYPVVDNAGNVVTATARVHEGDPRLAHATSSSIVGYKPTQYANENVSEHYAETAAAVTTGIPIPYSQAGVDVPQLVADNGELASFATGYRPDTRGQELFRNSVGADTHSLPAAFNSSTEAVISHVAPENDKLIQQQMIRTRQLRTLRPRDMIAILARVTERSKRG